MLFLSQGDAIAKHGCDAWRLHQNVLQVWVNAQKLDFSVNWMGRTLETEIQYHSIAITKEWQ